MAFDFGKFFFGFFDRKPQAIGRGGTCCDGPKLNQILRKDAERFALCTELGERIDRRLLKWTANMNRPHHDACINEPIHYSLSS